MIAEGETTAEAAAACGWRSFSYQGGSNGADRADYAAVKDLSVLIAPDNDRPGNKGSPYRRDSLHWSWRKGSENHARRRVPATGRRFGGP